MKSGRGLRIAVLTRRGRCASARAAVGALAGGGHSIAAVIAEPWQRLVFGRGWLRGGLTLLSRHGPRHLLARLGQGLLGGRPADSLADFCGSRAIPYHEVPDHNGTECARFLRESGADLLLSANTRVLSTSTFSIPPLGGINIHKGMLPRYAGLESIFWALYHGETEIGVSIHRLAAGIDTGDLLAQAAINVGPGDLPETLDAKADAEAGRLVTRVAAELAAGAAAAIPQDLSRRTYFSWPAPAQRRELAERLSRRRAAPHGPREGLLIVNADDFGLAEEVNRAVIACHLRGSVTSATLLANAPATAQACALARRHPTLGVGLHFNLTLGRPLCPPEEVPSLVDGSGRFPPRAVVERRALLRRLEPREIAREFDAQLTRLAAEGVKATHADGHQHVHMLPGVFPIVADLCRRHGLGLRRPSVAPICIRPRARGGPALTLRPVRRTILRLLVITQWMLHGSGLRGPERFASLFDCEPVPLDPTPEDYGDLLRPLLGPWVTELMVHPAESAQSLGAYTRIGRISACEYSALMLTDMAGLARRSACRLGHYGDLPSRPDPKVV